MWPTWDTGHGIITQVHVATIENRKQLIEMERFSDWKKMEGTMAHFLRFIKNIKNKRREPVFAEDYIEAEGVLIQQAQQEDNEMNMKKRKWRVFEIAHGMLRCNSRILNAGTPSDAKKPIFLPETSYLSKLLIMRYHTENYPCLTAQTLTQLRTKYWLPKGRNLARKTICESCMLYERWNARRRFSYPR